MRITTLEEHFILPDLINKFGQQSLHSKGQQLCDLNERRIAEIDAAGIDAGALSLTAPGYKVTRYRRGRGNCQKHQ